MSPKNGCLTLAFLFLCASQATAQQVSPPESRVFSPPDARPYTLLPPGAFDDTARTEAGNSKNAGKNGNGKNEDEGPEHTRDNGFLVEEASNQEPGVVQHIFNWINSWDRTAGGRTRDFLMAYVMELPLGSQKHQFSFLVPFQTTFEKSGGVAQQTGDVGDIFLNYRYQLLADDDFLWLAPRFSAILPSGDKRFGTGSGQAGFQFNLPVSRYGERFDFHFNAGYTIIPNVSLPLDPLLAGQPFSPRRHLHTGNLGASTFWKPQTYFHLFVEVLALHDLGIDDFGARDHATQVFVNPGFRWAICQLEAVEWVVGLSVPIGLTRDTPDIGLFAYMSVEHSFRRAKKG